MEDTAELGIHGDNLSKKKLMVYYLILNWSEYRCTATRIPRIL